MAKIGRPPSKWLFNLEDEEYSMQELIKLTNKSKFRVSCAMKKYAKKISYDDERKAIYSWNKEHFLNKLNDNKEEITMNLYTEFSSEYVGIVNLVWNGVVNITPVTSSTGIDINKNFIDNKTAICLINLSTTDKKGLFINKSGLYKIPCPDDLQEIINETCDKKGNITQKTISKIKAKCRQNKKDHLDILKKYRFIK